VFNKQMYKAFCSIPIKTSVLGLLDAYMVDFCWKCPMYHNMECTTHCAERTLMYEVLSELSNDLIPTPLGFMNENTVLYLDRVVESPYNLNSVN